MKRREFFDELTDAVRERLPPPQREFTARSTMNLLKIHYGANYRVHYEVMLLAEQDIIELGLHFEDGPESTSRLLAHFDERIVEIKHSLGEHAELERWTKSWGHLAEVRPLDTLNAALASELAERLATYIVTLQPVLADAYDQGLVSGKPRPSTFPRFRRG
jgi:hypothetical protein